MSSTTSPKMLRDKAATELKEFAWLTAYLLVAFGALGFYRSAALEAHGIHWFDWTLVIFKAAICAKFILIGRALHIGEGHRSRPLIWQILHKSFAFLLLVAGLTVIEDLLSGLRHGQSFAQSLAQVGGGTTEQMLASVVVAFLVFLPIFTLGALSEVMGAKALIRTIFIERTEFRPAPRPVRLYR